MDKKERVEIVDPFVMREIELHEKINILLNEYKDVKSAVKLGVLYSLSFTMMFNLKIRADREEAQQRAIKDNDKG